MKLKELEFKKTGDKWVSEPIQFWNSIAAVEYVLNSPGQVTIERCNRGRTFFPVLGFIAEGNSGAFNVTDGINGQFIRFIATSEPVYLSVIV